MDQAKGMLVVCHGRISGLLGTHLVDAARPCQLATSSWPLSDGNDKGPRAEHEVMGDTVCSDEDTGNGHALFLPKQLCFAKGCYGAGIVSTSVDGRGNTDGEQRSIVFEESAE